MGLRHRVLVCLFLGTLGLAAHAADEPLPIKVRRPVRSGDKFNVHLLFEQTRRESPLPPPATASSSTAPTTAASAPAGPETVIKADLTCRVDVLDVAIQGHVSAWITITKFISLPDNREIVPAGKVVGVLNDGSELYLALRDGGTLTADARAVLAHVHPLEYQLDETSFGSKAPRRAGDSWNVDPVSVAQVDSNAVFQIDAKSVQGKVTLVGPEKAGTVPALHLNATLSHSGQDRFARHVGDTLDRQTLTMQVNALFPLDPALPPLESQIVTDITSQVTRRPEKPAASGDTRLEIRTHTSAKQTITPVPK
jgi:hypothetical protein